jgi:hypothetical protein
MIKVLPEEEPPHAQEASPEIRDLARRYAGEAMAELARLATGANSEQARLSAIKEILDRAFGKALSALKAEAAKPASTALTELTDAELEAIAGRGKE